MGIETMLVPDLASPAVCAFLAGREQHFVMPFDDSTLKQDGFVPAGGSDRPISGEERLSLAFGRRDHFEIYASSTSNVQLAETTILVPIMVEVELTVVARLYIRSTLASEIVSGLQNALGAFDFGSGTDVLDFAAGVERQLDVRPSDYRVRLTFALKRLTRKELRDTEPSGSSAELPHQLDYRLVRSVTECPLQPRSFEDLGAIEVDDPEDIQVARDIAQNQAAAATDGRCHIVEVRAHRITTLFTYPEFKIAWRWEWFKIGCVWVAAPVPRLETRTAKKVLYATAAHGFNASGVVQIIVDCLEDAAISALVLGVITMNAGLAIVHLKAIFAECVMKQLTQEAGCLVPGVVTLVERNQWKPAW